MKYISKTITFSFLLLLTSLQCSAQDIEQYDLPSSVADITPNADSIFYCIDGKLYSMRL